jgi:hypothetical protein
MDRRLLAVLWIAAWLVALLASRGAWAAPPSTTPCRPLPTWEDEDSGALVPAGLTEEEIALAMGALTPRIERCVPAGAAITAQLRFHLEVACTGRVSAIETLEDGGLAPATVACLAGALREADLPPHDAPEGFGFDWRLRLMIVAPPKRRPAPQRGG